jgi:hypothetical protein
VSRLIGSCCIIELHKYFLKRENLPDDGKRKKAVVQQTYPRAHFEPAAFEKIKAAGSFCLSERFIVCMAAIGGCRHAPDILSTVQS